MLFHTQPDTPWEPLDFKLIEAFQMLEDETCPKCGQPTWLCRNPDPRVEFRVEETVCFATKAVEEKRFSRQNTGKNKKAATPAERKSWGLVEYPVPFVPKSVGGELPLRSEYYQAMNSESEMVD